MTTKAIARAAEIRANRMDLVSRWADDLAHEIKNPLHAMVINLELVKRRAGGPDADAIVQRAEVVEAELHRVHDLVDSLLRLVRPWPVAGAAEVDRVFQELLPVLGARARIRKLEFEHAPGGGVVGMAAGHLTLILLNLIDNAIEATPAGGRLLTACMTDERGVTITVRDTGSGLPEHLADRVTEPGITSREGRTGLGLAITARLIREAGGSLALQRAAGGVGTVATVVLPPPDAA